MENNESKLVTMQKEQGPLLEVKDLAIDFTTDDKRAVHAVRDVSFSVYPGQWVAIVGESGSGKSTSAMSVLGLLPGTGHVVGGSIKLDGQELVGLKQKDFDKLRGTKMGLVPQDPMSNLNPVWRIGTQVKEALVANNMDVAHEKRSKLAKALAGDEVAVKGNDDETFISSTELPALLDATKAAIAEVGITGEAAERSLAYFKEEWVPGSETRWRVADDLIKAGVKDDTAWDIAKKHVTGSTMDDRIAGLLSEAGLPDAATRARQFPPEFSGGMRPRALIAIGLAGRPDLL
ncbi:MAG: ATP-binding cassette domain-containing protein, partial [Bifidobacterium merycicum]|nr:ATP-binding cassette domain-containing protein [Bifidobacterium merycicum]